MGLITLSPASNIPGLVILGADGVHWMDVEVTKKTWKKYMKSILYSGFYIVKN
jgi:hypothetical protein